MEIKCPFSLKECVCGQVELCRPIIVSLMCQNKVLFEHVELSHHTSVVKGRFETCLGLRQPRVFLHHELIVYFITHFFGLCLSVQQWNKQDTYQNHYSQVRKAVTSVCVTFVLLPCPTYWPILPGQVKYVPPAIACPFGSGIDGTFSPRWQR